MSAPNPDCGPPPEKRMRHSNPNFLNVGERLYSQLAEVPPSASGPFGLVDVFFLAGPEKTRLPAHKCVLVGVSTAFATRMTERWEAGATFELPNEFSVEAVKAFIKVSIVNVSVCVNSD